MSTYKTRRPLELLKLPQVNQGIQDTDLVLIFILGTISQIIIKTLGSLQLD